MRVLKKALPKAIALLVAMTMVLAPLTVMNVQAATVPALRVSLANVDAGIQINTSALTVGNDYTISFWFRNATGRTDVMIQWTAEGNWAPLAGAPAASAAGEWVRHEVPFTALASNLQIVPNYRLAGDVWYMAEVTITPDGGSAIPVALNVATGAFGHWGSDVIATSIVQVSASYFEAATDNGDWDEFVAWLATPEGWAAFLATPEGFAWWISTPEGWAWWLSTEEGWNWFLSTPEGWQWFLSTPEGFAWYISTPEGWQWWLSTPEGWAWFLTTEEGQAWLAEQQPEPERSTLRLIDHGPDRNYERLTVGTGANGITFILVTLPVGYSNPVFSIGGVRLDFTSPENNRVYRYALSGTGHGILTVEYTPPAP